MGVLSSVRAVRWARKHQPEQVRYFVALAHERFPPDDLLRQAVQSVFSVGETDDASLERAREWKGTMVEEHYTDPVIEPAEIYRRGEADVSDSTFTKQIIASADPNAHVKRIKLFEKLGPTTIVLMNVSGGRPHDALRVYGERVLPELRG